MQNNSVIQWISTLKFLVIRQDFWCAGTTGLPHFAIPVIPFPKAEQPHHFLLSCLDWELEHSFLSSMHIEFHERMHYSIRYAHFVKKKIISSMKFYFLFSKASFEHHPRQRKLNEEVLMKAKLMLQAGGEKKKVQTMLMAEGGKQVTLRDVHNIARQETAKAGPATVDEIIRLLKSQPGICDSSDKLYVMVQVQQKFCWLNSDQL